MSVLLSGRADLFEDPRGGSFLKLLEDVSGICEFCEEDHSCDDIWFVACFFVERISVAVEYACIHFAFLAAYACDIGRQTVHIESLSIFCCLHQLFRTCPVFVLCVLSKQFLFQFFDTVEVAVAVQLGTFLHCREGSPALGIYDICIFERLSHTVGLREGSAGFLRILSSYSLYLREYLISFRMSQNHVHPETSHQSYDTLGNGEGLAIGRRVCPCLLLFF